MRWRRYRSVVLSDSARNIVDEKTKTVYRFDDAWQSLEWLLARIGHKLGLYTAANAQIYRLYRQAGDEVARTPDITILFTATDNEIIVHAMRVLGRD